MVAAFVAVIPGGYLWSQLHAGGFGTPERVLAIGAACAVIAAGIQGRFGGLAIRALRRGSITDAPGQPRHAIWQPKPAPLVPAAGIFLVDSPHLCIYRCGGRRFFSGAV